MWFIGLLFVVFLLYLIFCTGLGKSLIKIAICISAFELCITFIPIPGVNILVAIILIKKILTSDF